MSGRYQVKNASGENGILYISLQDEHVPRWTLTIWKRPEGVFDKQVEDLLRGLAPKFMAIPNDHAFHKGAHLHQPAAFDAQTHYMQHIHIASNSLMKKAKLRQFLDGLVQQRYLLKAEVPHIVTWAEDMLADHYSSLRSDED